MILSRNRLYTREEPKKEAKLIIIYCEGKKREYQYFIHFAELSSQIRLEVEAPSHHDNTSPLGLYKKAQKHIVKSEENLNPKYELTQDDEVWFVIDTDKWNDKILELRKNCRKYSNWFVSQSNPCFEVWLFYHLFKFEEFENMDSSKAWKSFLNEKIKGGFDSKKHPIFIQTAIVNSKMKFNPNLEIGSTEVFKLAESFLPFIKNKINEALCKIETT